MWSTEFVQSLAFQFLVLDKKQLIWATRIQYRSLTVSEMEPGALYTAEIETDVCREESSLSQTELTDIRPTGRLYHF